LCLAARVERQRSPAERHPILGAGAASVEVTFSADSLVNGLGVNGPWQVSEVKILEQVGGHLVSPTAASTLGSTAAYDLAFAQPTLIRLNGTNSAVGIDTNNNVVSIS
jgi:hypothetical protein